MKSLCLTYLELVEELEESFIVKLAAIDIGSNSIKLIVVDAAASDSFAVLAREKEVARLGHETLTKGVLSPEAIERAITCIQRFKTAAEVRQTEEIVAVATASVREAKNSSQFIRQVGKATGIRVDILVRRRGSQAYRTCCITWLRKSRRDKHEHRHRRRFDRDILVS